MEVIKDSTPVDKTKLDPNKVWRKYIKNDPRIYPERTLPVLQMQACFVLFWDVCVYTHVCEWAI